jgi:hypothetical protein
MIAKTPCLAVLVAAAAGTLSSTASAQLTHYIPFDLGYVAGGDINGLGSFDLGFGVNVWFDGAAAGEGTTIVEGDLGGAPGLDRMGNHAKTPDAAFNLAFYTFDLDGDLANGEPEDSLAPGVHWISFIARSTTEADFGGVSFVKFFGPEILYMGKVGGNGGTEWGMDAGGGQQSAGGDVNADTFIAVKLTIGPGANDDTAEMFINPAVGSMPSTPDASVSFNEDPNDNRAIDEIRLGSQNGPFSVDEIRIGATFADVSPGTPPVGGCNPADLAEPFNQLTFGDISAFLAAFDAMDPAADLADPFGQFTFGDISAFLAAFNAGCP